MFCTLHKNKNILTHLKVKESIKRMLKKLGKFVKFNEKRVGPKVFTTRDVLKHYKDTLKLLKNVDCKKFIS